MALPKITALRAAIVLLASAALVLLLQSPRERAAASNACESDRADALAVLFIGNSHTYVNDLPKMFCDLASAEHPLRLQSVTAGGWSLAKHWADGTALRAIREQGPWTHVVLQEHSTSPLLAPAEFEASVRRFNEAVRAAGARPVLYELWPRRDTKQDPLALHRTYAEVAHRAGMLLVPVGPAWTASAERHPSLDLFQPDGYHAQPAGTYIAACVFFGALLQRSPEGRPGIPGMSRDLTFDLQRIAWRSLDVP